MNVKDEQELYSEIIRCFGGDPQTTWFYEYVVVPISKKSEIKTTKSCFHNYCYENNITEESQRERQLEKNQKRIEK